MVSMYLKLYLVPEEKAWHRQNPQFLPINPGVVEQPYTLGAILKFS